MSTLTLVFILVGLLFLIIFQISKSNEYVAILKGEDASNEETDNASGWMFIVFMLFFFGFIFWTLEQSMDKMILVSSSMHGKWIDSMMNTTIFFTGIIFFACHIMLFVFCYIYKGKTGKVAYYYPENNKLEMIWTIIPAIVLTVLVVIGLYRWFQITLPPPSGTTVVEITGKQFNWIARYPGKDGKLGKKEFKLIDESNALGINFSDPDSRDDMMPAELHFEVNKPVMLNIGARDVIHNVGMPHFSVKMDAVPGIPTHFWFTPTVTTDEMKVTKNNPDFVYELCCDMICGKGHSAMRMVIVIDTPEQYAKWLSSQKSIYDTQIKGADLEKKFALNTTTSPNIALTSLNP